MSTKTIKQRIAVVAVSALTAGLLTVVAAPASNASTVASGGGIAVTTSTGTVVLPTMNGGSTTGTGTITATGNVTLSISGGSSGLFVEARVSGGTFTSVTNGIVNGAGTAAYQAAASSTAIAVTAKPTSAGRNMVISTYTGTTAALASSSTTAIETLTITVVASGVSGVANAGASYLQIVNTTSTLTATSNTDATYANIVAAGGVGIASYSIRDALTINLPSTTVIQATVKSGACVVATSSAFSPAGTSIVTAAQAGQIYVAQADSTNTPAAVCTVDISADGALIGTKTFTFQGPVAKLVVTGLARGKTSTANTSMGYITAQDSAGNSIGNVALTGELVSPASADSSIVTAVLGVTTAVGSATVNGGTSPASTPVTIGWTCSSTSSTGVKIKYKASNGIGGYIYSDDIVATCAGNPATYTASLDKASYLPGDIATLTITAKDSKGNLTNDAATLSSGSTISITGSNLTAVTTPLSTDTFSGGSKTVKFTVGATSGAYNLIVDLPLWNSTTYSQTAISVPYKITASSGVTNEQVLQSIVALIASINKQIQALQALILKKR